MPADRRSLTWVVLTMGNRPVELDRAVRSILDDDAGTDVVVVSNGGGPLGLAERANPRVSVIELSDNTGIPGGRDHAVRSITSDLVGFLDDDAVAEPGIREQIAAAFDADPWLGAVSLRLVDEQGTTTRRHVPRLGGRRPQQGGDVALFLGGACAIRREAYDDAGGYWGDLFYGHEELELSWRLIDHGWRIRYVSDAIVYHPRTMIGRHQDGWRMTGRNRVAIARRTLPWPVAAVHVTVWLLLGAWRAGERTNRIAYLQGWWSGWSMRIERRPIGWSTVLRLIRLGRPPIV